MHRAGEAAGGGGYFGGTGRARAIAIVGLGPRGLSVLERLLIRLRQAPSAQETVIWAVDAVEHGPGRVWRTSQPWWLTTNATASELTAQSPADGSGPNGGFLRPVSLDEWTQSSDYPDAPLEPVGYPPRRVYGEYLRDVFMRLCAGAPPGVEVRPILGEATRLTRSCGRLSLTLGDGSPELAVDKVVLATGHVPLEPTAEQQMLLGHRTYIGEGIAADMALDEIRPGTTVAVRGLGLTFYDVIRSLSVGRGGEFVREPSGRLAYRASGREPMVVAGSRRGLPFLARPRVTQAPDTAPRPVVLTEWRIAELRARAVAERGTPQLDFGREVEPVIHAELDLAYCACAARLRDGHDAAERFIEDFRESLDRWGRIDPPARQALRAKYGLEGLPGLRLDELARPFDKGLFPSPSHFDARLLGVLRADVAEARQGPLASPRKAALEVFRQIRPLLPSIVDFGGLLPASHRDFLERFEPLNYVLSAGPPDAHVEQLVSLIESGIVRVVGPAARFDVADSGRGYVVESPKVRGSRCAADVLVEARVPATDIGRTASPLIRRMVADGMVSQYVNTDPASGERFETGGLAITPAPFHVINGRGEADPDIYAIGVATDRTRWFTQVGTGRPGHDSPFCRDADAIAADILSQAHPGYPLAPELWHHRSRSYESQPGWY